MARVAHRPDDPGSPEESQPVGHPCRVWNLEIEPEGAGRLLRTQRIASGRPAQAPDITLIAHQNNGEYDRAVADCDKAIRLDPNDASRHIGRGLIYKDNGDPCAGADRPQSRREPDPVERSPQG
ncbi:MAG: tetratricopeptide repeat protein [bacterium]|nr:tetratricopeptide repeat protein [bacterium]